MKLKKKSLQIANYQKQILINDTEGKTNISSLSVYRQWDYKIIVIERVMKDYVAEVLGKNITEVW